MDIEKTRRYYVRLTDADVCDCAYCRNYVKEIRAAYPELDAYADQLGIDLEKPLETIPVEPAEGRILYSGAQYVVLGPLLWGTVRVGGTRPAAASERSR